MQQAARSASRLALGLSVLMVVSCTRAQGPYTRSALHRDSRERPARALLRYLAQPNADAAACRRGAQGVAWASDEVVEVVAEAIEEGQVAAELGGRCLSLLLDEVRPKQLPDALAGAAEAYARVLKQRPFQPERAQALHAAVVRAERTARHGDVLHTLVDALAPDLTEGPEPGRTLAREIVIAAQARAGRWVGQPFSEAQLTAVTDEQTLALLTIYLPSASARGAVRAERIRRRAATSTFAEVRADLEGVVARVLATGHNAIDLGRQRTRQVWVEHDAAAITLVVQQQPRRAVAMLRARFRDALALAPSIFLRGFVWLTVDGIEQPVTLCDLQASDDPTPCVAPRDVSMRSGAGVTMRDAALVFAEELPIADTLPWLGDDGKVEVPLVLHVGGAQASVRLTTVFEVPPALSFGGKLAAVDLVAQVEVRAGHAIVQVEAAEQRSLVVVPIDAPADFRVVTVGAAGRDGRAGWAGSPGSDGSSGEAASCGTGGHRRSDGGRGGNGGRGEDGGDGGVGGTGGDIAVIVRCPSARCDALALFARGVFHSQGGPGGAGGRGGAGGSGGRGGAGGSGAICTENGKHYSLPSGHSGLSGSPGMSGSDGMSGTTGMPGRVTLQVVGREPAARSLVGTAR